MQKIILLKFMLGLFLGVFLGAFFVSTTFYIIFEKVHGGKIYPGVRISGVDFGGKTKTQVKDFFNKKNESFSQTAFIFYHDKESVTTISAKELDFGFESNLLADQAYSLGRSRNIISNAGILISSLEGQVDLAPSYSFTQAPLRQNLADFEKKINRAPIDALFTFQNGRVLAFQPSSDGAMLDWNQLASDLQKRAPLVGLDKKYSIVEIQIPVKVLKPKIATSEVNNLGIKELIGTGKSSFVGSIPNRVHNISLAASTIHGVMIAPGETFSFNDVLGDVSKFTGYKEAYIIKDGRTILGDGGGVCQVSTTLFRAILSSGLPVVERHPHSYRVSYYEQDSDVGLDATVYSPGFDLRFKNDSKNHVLIQAGIDKTNMKLKFDLYGTGDGRTVTIEKSVIKNQVASPPDLYQDDSNLPKGTTKQVDFKAWGADVTFSRRVEKNGQTLMSENFRSQYRPWQAVFLRGTKEP